MDEGGANLDLGDTVTGEQGLHQAEVACQQHAVLLPDDGGVIQSCPQMSFLV